MRWERENAERAQADQGRQRQAVNWEVIDRAVQEFVSAAHERHLPTKGVMRPRWVVYVRGSRLDSYSSYVSSDPSDYLTIYPSGRWKFEHNLGAGARDTRIDTISESGKPGRCSASDDVVADVRPALVSALSA